MGVAWPLTGRAEELQYIHAAMTSSSGRPAGVVLAGLAGVGKTRLVQEALAQSAGRGATVRWVVATESARALPWGAFSAFIGPDVVHTDAVVQKATAALLAGAGHGDVVVGIDDAHLLDDFSAMLVHHLVVRNAATVVVTIRTGMRAPDAVTALWKDGHLSRLEVQTLSAAETRVLLESGLRGRLDARCAGRLWALTQGNVLFLRHLVDAEIDGGRLRERDGVWYSSGEAVVPPKLVELVAERMGAMSDGVREIVDTLALAEPLDADVLDRVIRPGPLEQAEDLGLVRTEAKGRQVEVRLAHPLYGEVRRAEMGLLRARRLRGRVAAAMVDTGEPREWGLLRRAALVLDSDLAPEPHLFTAAATVAMGLLDLDLAERLAVAAVADTGTFDARLLHADIQSLKARGERADAEYAALVETSGGGEERARAVAARATNLLWVLHRPADAVALLRAAEDDATDRRSRKEVAATRSNILALLGRPQEAVTAAREALGPEPVSDETVFPAIGAIVCGLGLLGRIEEVGDLAARGYLLGGSSAEWLPSCLGIGHAHIVGLSLAGLVHEAHTVAEERRQACSGLPGELHRSTSALLGMAALSNGRLRTGMRLLGEFPAERDVSAFGAACMLGLGQASALLGDLAVATRMLDELDSRRHPAFGFREPEIVLARAWVAAGQGAVTEAIGLTHRAAAMARERGQLAHEVLALQTATRLGDTDGVDRLAALATVVQGPRSPAAAAHVVALAAGDADGLGDVSLRLEDMGDALSAADAAAQAAVAYFRLSRNGDGHIAVARARRLAQGCDGARTPALLAAFRPLPLTAREREVVTLAAEGLSNRQIAARLVISTRTVEGHLYRSTDKLGITERTQLAALLRGDGGPAAGGGGRAPAREGGEPGPVDQGQPSLRDP